MGRTEDSFEEFAEMYRTRRRMVRDYIAERVPAEADADDLTDRVFLEIMMAGPPSEARHGPRQLLEWAERTLRRWAPPAADPALPPSADPPGPPRSVLHKT